MNLISESYFNIKFPSTNKKFKDQISPMMDSPELTINILRKIIKFKTPVSTSKSLLSTLETT